MPNSTVKVGANPLVRQLGLKQILQRDSQPAPEPSIIHNDPALDSALASHVKQAWQRNKLSKQRVDLKLLDCLRARRGIYSPAALSQMQNSGGNLVFVDLTETKCRAASAWIREIVLPVGEQPWGVDPTPIPELPMPLKQAVVRKALEQANQVMTQVSEADGGVMDPTEFKDLALDLTEKLRDEAETMLQRKAKDRAKRMERQIADRLTQGGYAKAMDGFVEDFVTYPAAILKGPVYTRKRELEWGANFEPKVSDNPRQTWFRVSPFDCYPAPASRDPQQGDFIERVRFRREELYDLKGLPGYKDDQIDDALLDYSNGHLEGWLWTEAERQRLEQETLYMWLSPPGVIDALNYWGGVPGWKLMSWGVTSVDGKPLEETRDYECNVLICGRYVLYAAINPDPLNKRPYHRACYDEIPGAFWGRSIPDLCSTSQKMCNSLASALADNLSISSGPQVWVHGDRLADGEQTLEMFPWKIWQLKSDAQQGVNPGIGFFQPMSNADSLMATFDKWEMKADDATGIPRYTYGNEHIGGAGDTASGLSMLMNSAAKGLRRGISNIDANVIGPTIEMTFINEMLYNPDDSIKGDCVPVPRGAAAILIRESAQQRRMQFLNMTANPIDQQLVGGKYRLALLRETASAMELPVDEVVPSDDAYEQQQAQAAQSAQEQQQGMMQAEAAKEQSITQREQQAQAVKGQTEITKQVLTTVLGSMKDSQPKESKPAPKKPT